MTASTKPHWTQTPEGKKRMSEIQKMAQKAIKAKRKLGRPKGRKNGSKDSGTVLVVNGWRVTLGKNEVRIDSE